MSHSSLDVNKLRYADLKQEELEFLLLSQHERDHFENYFSTPYGLIIFRCYLCLTSTMNWLFVSFFQPGGLGHEVPQGQPFKNWVLKDGIAWIRAKIRSGDLKLNPRKDAEEKSFVAATGLPYGDGILRYLQVEVLPEIEAVSDFLHLLLHRKEGATLGDFAQAANRAYGFLAKRGDVSAGCRWTTRRPDSPLHPVMSPILTGTELFELSALSCESEILRAVAAPEGVVADWKDGYSHPPYEAGLELARESGIPISVLATMAKNALSTPCDLVINSGDELLVETHHPTWRFRNQAFVVIDSRDCPRTGLDIRQRFEVFSAAYKSNAPGVFEKMLCSMALEQIPYFPDTFNANHSPLMGPGSNVLPNVDSKDKAVDVRYGVADILTKFETSMAAAAMGDSASLSRTPERIVYRDDVASFPGMESLESLPTVLGYHSGVMASYLQLTNLLEGITPSKIPALEVSVIARIGKLLGEVPEALAKSIEVSALASTVFGRSYARAVGFDVT